MMAVLFSERVTTRSFVVIGNRGMLREEYDGRIFPRASISISTLHARLSKAATTTMVAAGRIWPKNSPADAAHGLPVFNMGEIHTGAGTTCLKEAPAAAWAFSAMAKLGRVWRAASSLWAPTGPVPAR